jgi:hypothetical protein
MTPTHAAAAALAATLALTAPAAAGPYTPVTQAQVHQVHHGQTRWHIEHHIFHNATGIPEAHWPHHQVRVYRRTNGGLLEITYHRPHGAHHWRATHTQNATD